MKVAYLGAKSSHTYAAAYEFFGKEAEYVGLSSIRKCITAICHGIADKCVVPIENSVEGTVSESIDSFVEFSVFIEGEVVLPIRQSLIGFENTDINNIKTIYSHPQALSQCRNYLDINFKDAELIAVSSTSEAMDKLKDETAAAIARVPSEGLVVLKKNIEDYDSNETRFIALSPNPTFEGNKCSILFDLGDKPGELLRVLEVFNSYSINMTKIESRPAKSKLGSYVFYIDFIMPQGNDKLSEFLSKLQNKTTYLKFLGKYNGKNKE